MRTIRKYNLEDPSIFKKKLLSWSRKFHEISWLDSNNYAQKESNFEAVLAVEGFTVLKTDYFNAFEKLREYQEKTADWIFGFLTYDLKNDIEYLKSENPDHLGFPDLYFFQPQKLFFIKGDSVELHYLKMVDDEMSTDLEEIHALQLQNSANISNEVSLTSEEKNHHIQSRISREEYLEKVQKMLHYIHRGNIYEANFCQEFYMEDAEIDPFPVFEKLNRISVPPFAAFFKLDDKYLLSASPERYLKKSGQKISSQPIKGTAPRSKDPAEDKKIADALSRDSKERTENIMIVDLVRNDLSKIGEKGSVQVEELCSVYTFEQVHQLISTVTAQLDKNIPAVEAIKATFPMGSMTGAPKISAMKIIEELEESKRGLYSGAVGYFTPSGDFDFNVVIRSILYNSAKQYVSFSVGGAITSSSNPEKEYDECLLKSKAMREVLTS